MDVRKGDVIEGKNHSELFQKIAEEFVLSSGGVWTAFFVRALSAPIEEGLVWLVHFAIVEHREGERYALAEAFVVDIMHVLVQGVNFVVKGVGIGTANDAAILELSFEHFYTGADELTFLIESDF